MMKMNGFTLAEALLAIAVVGIISALSLPSLISNVEQKKVGPALVKAVNTLESANSLLLQQKDSRTLSGTVKDEGCKENYLGCILEGYTKLTTVPYAPTKGDLTNAGGTAYGTKDGVVFIPAGKGSTDASTKVFAGEYFIVYIDVNGERGPNKNSRDIFLVYVDEKGVVVPVGGYAASDYGLTESWADSCPSRTSKTDKTVPTKGTLTCTGSIIDNGGRILYNYDGMTD